MTTLAVPEAARREARARRQWIGPTTYVGSAAGLIGSWALAAWVVNSIYFPQPWSVAIRFAQLAQGRLPGDVAASLQEAFGGWALGSALGIVAGMVIGSNQVVAECVKPLLNLLRHISALAWVPLMILWFGIGYWSKTSIIVLVAFFILVVNTAHGVSSIEPLTLKASLVLRQRPSQRLELVIMSAMPDILVGLRFALGTAWGGVVIAELVAGNVGLGALELFGGQAFDVAQVMVGMLVIAGLSLLANVLLLAAQKLAFPWLISNRGDTETGVGA